MSTYYVHSTGFDISKPDKGQLHPRPRKFLLVAAIFILLLGSWCSKAIAQEQDLINLSLEDLMNVEVTSVSKKAEKRTEAAAAIFVITEEDIRRSTARTLPDLLRTVPGISVSQINDNKWSVTARGFGGRFANKLLVLIDGRSIYTQQFSGVLWEMHDIRLEDIDRIEVIRGPGGTLWGANAVNGVINIQTKNAKDTQGVQVVTGFGNKERGFGSLRIGGKLQDDFFYRAYFQGFNRSNESSNSNGMQSNDDWSGGSAGFRGDWSPTDDDHFVLSAGLTDVDSHEDVVVPVPTGSFATLSSGTNISENRYVVGNWTHTLSDDSSFQLQMYYDQYRSESITLGEIHNTFDVDFQHNFQLGDRHEIVWGARFRYHEDDFRNTPTATFTPSSRSDNLYSAFIQDTIALDETLKLTLGTKLEHNSFTDFEFQPSIRVAWTPDEIQTVWGAVSRAVRTPSRAEDDISLTNVFDTTPLGTTGFVFIGNRGYKSETLTAFELGYRRQIGSNTHVDIATFYNIYDNLRTVRTGTTTTLPGQWPGLPIVPLTVANESDGETYGVEVTLDWYPQPEWLVRVIYAHLEANINIPSGALGLSDNDTPENQVSIINQVDLPNGFEADATVRYVDEILNNTIGNYVELDLRLGWKPSDELELALVGINLLNNGHFESQDTILSFLPSEVPRSVSFKVTWEF